MTCKLIDFHYKVSYNKLILFSILYVRGLRSHQRIKAAKSLRQQIGAEQQE